MRDYFPIGAKLMSLNMNSFVCGFVGWTVVVEPPLTFGATGAPGPVELQFRYFSTTVLFAPGATAEMFVPLSQAGLARAVGFLQDVLVSHTEKNYGWHHNQWTA